MELILSGILISVIGAIFSFIFRKDAPRNAIVCVVSIAMACMSIAICAYFVGNSFDGNTIYIPFTSHLLDYICFGISVCLALLIIIMSIRYKKWIALCLAIVQLSLSIYIELACVPDTSYYNGFSIDILSCVMGVIVGVVGGAICIYALGYMKDFQAHEPEDATDRRPIFFLLMIAFLGAMYLLIFSNNIMWMLCGWEATTVCSFLLIGYTKTDEAINNSFKQIIYNLIGGISFSIGAFFIIKDVGVLDFNVFLQTGLADPNIAKVPLFCLTLAALTKAAQMPFYTWILGAMVAPTPASALLHSSTMVKAGVFLLIKLSPLYAGNKEIQFSLLFICAFTFLLCSMMAISVTNGKRVLALSTVANLALIGMSAGFGTAFGVWVAIILLIFHSVAKSLLFLCVGTAEHHIGSRDIETFDALFNKMPRLARFMSFGILCMFVFPFGMLVGKWGVILETINATNTVLVLFMAFGSAATFMYWAKWLGKISGIISSEKSIEGTTTKYEMSVFYFISTTLFILNIALPFISYFVADVYAAKAFSFAGFSSAGFISNETLILCVISAVIVFLTLFLFVDKKRKRSERQLTPYLSGYTVSSDERTFKGSFGEPMKADMRNLYIESFFGPQYGKFGQILSLLVIIYGLVMVII